MTGTAPADGAACYTDWKAYSDATCATDDATATTGWKDLKLSAGKKATDCAGTEVLLSACDNGKITTVTCTAAATGTDGSIAYTKYDGTECVKVSDTVYAKFKPAGWTAAAAAETNATNATNATGAKSLAAAVAAGALAVAATQF